MQPDQPGDRAAFVMGVATLLAVLALLFSFLTLRLGLDRLSGTLGDLVLDATRSKTQRVLELPDPIREELAALHAVFDNAGNPTDAPRHDTLLTRPDDEFGYVLRPGVRVDCYLLRARNRFNLDPPVLYLPGDARPSEDLARYIEEQARVHYVYRIAEDGRRLTLPRVRSARRVLVVGDSVAFGSGVRDEDTFASAMQRRLGGAVQVINAGVGGYTGEQAVRVARALVPEGGYEALVYFTSQNDFVSRRSWRGVDAAEALFAELGALRDRFSDRVVVLVVPWIAYALDDLLFMHERGEHLRAGTRELYRELPAIAERHGLIYVDFLEPLVDETRARRSIFARFALYADRAHLSPRGNELGAALVHEALRASGFSSARRGAALPPLASAPR